MMKVTCLYGSPRSNGNSAQIAKKFIQEAENLGAEVTQFTLNTLNFKGCQGCYVCKTKQDHCTLNDDLKPVLESVKETDILVIATPVYYSDITSQLKAFIDRTYSFVEADYMTNPNASRLDKGKKLVFIQTQEAGKESFGDIFTKYSLYFQFYGFEECKFIQVGSVGQLTDMTGQKEVFKEVEETAKLLCAA
jgi:multimeric flavodoxin WrbA